MIDALNFSPYPKNPIIAKFFRAIGLADELGSGVKNVTRYLKVYSGGTSEFIEADIFNRCYRLMWKVLLPHKTPHKINMLNEAHFAIAGLEKRGLIKAVITQNIDGLHQKAGSRWVIELHGTADRYYCIKTGNVNRLP